MVHSKHAARPIDISELTITSTGGLAESNTLLTYGGYYKRVKALTGPSKPASILA
jgi:hypothetical protein